mmetsp:Transcript_24159/g.48328  ORF Transcript_24159/g.48328 Transcript_24159/m.48328 type:complete len:104 (+) Transcript_24159:1659-1970(+)
MIEIHAALRQELDSRADYFYQELCSRKLGVRWVPYAPDDFRPKMNASKTRRAAIFTEAWVPPKEFAAVVRRALRFEEHPALLKEYAARLRAHPVRAQGRFNFP